MHTHDILHVFRNDLQSAQILLDNGADPNIKRDDGMTPLHYAACEGNSQNCCRAT